jgi:hypothetical protein
MMFDRQFRKPQRVEGHALDRSGIPLQNHAVQPLKRKIDIKTTLYPQ